MRPTYTALAPFYSGFVRLISSRARQLGVDRLNLSHGDRALDAGTGSGLALRTIARRCSAGSLTGIDRTPAMLDRARRRLRQVPASSRPTLLEGDMRALPFPAASFDAVFSSYAVDVLPEPDRQAALREMMRVLRPGGRLVVVTMAPPRRTAGRLWARASRLVPLLLGGAHPVSVAGVARSIRPQGRIQQTERAVQAGFPSQVVVAKRRSARADRGEMSTI